MYGHFLYFSPDSYRDTILDYAKLVKIYEFFVVKQFYLLINSNGFCWVNPIAVGPDLTICFYCFMVCLLVTQVSSGETKSPELSGQAGLSFQESRRYCFSKKKILKDLSITVEMTANGAK